MRDAAAWLLVETLQAVARSRRAHRRVRSFVGACRLGWDLGSGALVDEYRRELARTQQLVEDLRSTSTSPAAVPSTSSAARRDLNRRIPLGLTLAMELPPR